MLIKCIFDCSDMGRYMYIVTYNSDANKKDAASPP